MRISTIASFGLALLATSCSSPTGDDDSGPGVVAIRLVSPNSGDAAMRFTLYGPGITGITAEGDFVVFSRADGASSHPIAVFGDLANGAVMRFHVPDLSKLESYSAVLHEVAASDNTLRPSVDGYSVIIER